MIQATMRHSPTNKKSTNYISFKINLLQERHILSGLRSRSSQHLSRQG